MKIKLIILISILVLQGCIEENEKTTEPTHDVSWYSSHENERTSKLAECKNNPGELSETPNCKNAKEAQQKKSGGRGSIDLSKW
jgi:hypothetical protein